MTHRKTREFPTVTKKPENPQESSGMLGNLFNLTGSEETPQNTYISPISYLLCWLVFFTG